MNGKLLAKCLALVVLLAGGLLVFIYLPVRQYLTDFFNWVAELGVWGPVILGAAYIPACVFLVPGSLMTMGAGFAFGLLKGTVAVSLGSTAGVAVAFIVGRTIARSWIERLTSGNVKLKAVDQAVEHSGFKIVLLTRLSPLFPFTLLNYFYGLTRVRFRDYVLASWIGMLPGTIMYVYFGSIAQSLSQISLDELKKSTGSYVLTAAGLVATVVVTILVTRLAKRALEEAVPAQKQPQESKLEEART